MHYIAKTKLIIYSNKKNPNEINIEKRGRKRKLLEEKKGNISTPVPTLNCADGCNDFENGFYDNVF